MDRIPVAVTASSAKTVTGNSGPLAVPGGSTSLSIVAAVSAVSGTGPSMTLGVQWSDDGATFADGDPADVFTAISATGNKVKTFTVKGTTFQLVWTITGTTPSFTFASTAYGV